MRSWTSWLAQAVHENPEATDSKRMAFDHEDGEQTLVFYPNGVSCFMRSFWFPLSLPIRHYSFDQPVFLPACTGCVLAADGVGFFQRDRPRTLVLKVNT